MDFILSTGGREKYFKALNVSDCVTRAIAIATETDYKKIYDLIYQYAGESPRNGVYPLVVDNVLLDLGWKYHKPRKEIYLADYKPKFNVVICRTDKHHITTIKHGDLYDMWDCRRKNPRVVGYWTKPNLNHGINI